MAKQLRIVGLDKLAKRFSRLEQNEIKTRSLRQSGLYIAGWSKKYRLSGRRPQYLGVVSGRLRASISASKVRKLGERFFTYIGTNVKYARIHEKGGTIRAKNVSRLKYRLRDGSWRSSKSVKIPARPFLQPAIEDRNNRREVINIILRNINRALEKTG